MEPPKLIPSALNPQGAPEDSKDGVLKQAVLAELAWLDPLVKDPNFQTFWKFFATGVDKLRENALNVTQFNREQRDAFAYQHAALRHWLEWPTAQHATLVAMLDRGSEREKAKAAQPPPAP